MKKITVKESERALVFNNGRFEKVLKAGSYRLWGKRNAVIMQVEQSEHPFRPISIPECPIEILKNIPEIAKETVYADIPDATLGLFFRDGKFRGFLPAGQYLFWQTGSKVEIRQVDISTPEIGDNVPEYIFKNLRETPFYTRIEVKQWEKARLYFNGKFIRLLPAGAHYFWKNGISVTAETVDTRLTALTVSGQDILTADKVSLRVNFTCNYRITDCIRVAETVDDYRNQIYVCAQLAIREYVGKYKLDEVLENKEQMSEFILSRLKAKENELFVEFSDAGVKDIILPGEVREIMNTVLIAEKKAQANVISRREEVASTRSLLNTAKLMEENKTLYKLKEMEYVERICENVGNINIGGGDILAKLTAMISPDALTTQ